MLRLDTYFTEDNKEWGSSFSKCHLNYFLGHWNFIFKIDSRIVFELKNYQCLHELRKIRTFHLNLFTRSFRSLMWSYRAQNLIIKYFLLDWKIILFVWSQSRVPLFVLTSWMHVQVKWSDSVNDFVAEHKLNVWRRSDRLHAICLRRRLLSLTWMLFL